MVMDLCDSDHQRRTYAQAFLDTGDMPESLQPVCQTRLRGKQTTPRAELAALDAICQFPGYIVTFTDCQSALSIVWKLQAGTFFLSDRNQPGLRSLQRYLRPGHEFRKIQAHTDLRSPRDLLDLHLVLGNHVVDQAAREACNFGQHALRARFEQRHSTQALQENLHELYKLIVALQHDKQQSSCKYRWINMQSCSGPTDI